MAARVRSLPAEMEVLSADTVSDASEVSRLRNLSASAVHASAFLMALPGPGTTLDDAKFHDA